MADGLIVSDGTPRHVMTADTLTAAYGVEIDVVEHPFRDCPLVLVT